MHPQSIVPAQASAGGNLPRRREILFVSAGLDLAGGGRAVAARLLAHGSARFAEENEIGWRLVSLRGLNGLSADPRARSFHDRQLSLACHIWRLQVTSRHVACVFDLLGPARLQSLLPKALRAPYLIPLYGIEAWRTLSTMRRRSLRGASIRLAVSEYTRERTLAVQGLDRIGDVEVLPLCLEDRPPAGEIDRGVLDRLGREYVLIVGRMAATERYKGHDQLLQAMALLQPAARPLGDFQTNPQGVGKGTPHLVIVGEGDDRPRLEALAGTLGIAPQVLFTGFVSEATLKEIYARAAVMVMPSRGEGFGLVYLEAMRARRPCIGARASAAAEIVVDGETGLLVNPLDPREIATAIARVLGSPELAGRWGAAGQHRFEQLFTPQKFRERLWPLLDRLTS